MTDALLPPGIKIGVGLDENDQPVVCIDIGGLAKPVYDRDWPSGNAPQPVNVAVVITPRQARALGALLLKQADLIEAAERGREGRPMLGVIEGGR